MKFLEQIDMGIKEEEGSPVPRMVSDQLELADLNYYSTLEQVITYLHEVQEVLNSKNATDERVYFGWTHGYYDDIERDFYVTFMRPETQIEIDARLKKSEKAKVAQQNAKAKKLAEEKKEYERLKKKFEGKKFEGTGPPGSTG
jgi:hypothetical protein